MIAALSVLVLSQSLSAAVPDAIHAVLESQLPLWAVVMGNPAVATDGEERIAVERSTSTTTNVFLIDRKLKVVVMRDDQRSWLADVVWCGAGTGTDRCEDVWARPDAQWRSDKTTANHTGYAVYRDQLQFSVPQWGDVVPSLGLAKKQWDKGLCEGGLCFVVSGKDSSVVRAAVRADGSVAWWDGGYIMGSPLEKEMVHAYKYLLEHGHALAAKKP